MKNLTVEITDMCPLYCMHCSTHASWDREDIQMSFEDFSNILESNQDFEEIRISGGEPFIHERILDFTKEAKERGHYVNILSCGVYRNINDYSPIPEEMLQEGKDSIDHISLSLHGPRETHNMLTEAGDTFQYFDKSIDRIIKEKIPFSFGFVPLTVNADSLEESVQYASEKSSQQNYCSPSISLLRYVKQGSQHYAGDDPDIVEVLGLTKEQNNQIIEQGEELENKYGIPIIPTCSMLEKGCTAGSDKKVITVYGEECGCSALKFSELYPPAEKGVACSNRH